MLGYNFAEGVLIDLFPTIELEEPDEKGGDDVVEYFVVKLLLVASCEPTVN